MEEGAGRLPLGNSKANRCNSMQAREIRSGNGEAILCRSKIDSVRRIGIVLWRESLLACCRRRHEHKLNIPERLLA
jgi:hypothetical protein